MEKLERTLSGLCEATISYDAANEDRAVFVGWGDSDAGASMSAWGSKVESASGYARAGSVRTKVVLSPDASSAKVVRLFLHSDGCTATYLRSDGKQLIETDVHPGPMDTKVFADFQMQDITTVQQRIFGSDSGMQLHAYINGSKGWSWSYSNTGNWTIANPDNKTQIYATKDRTQVTIDGPNDKYTLVINGVQKATRTLTSANKDNCTNQGGSPIYILADGVNRDKYGNLKLYALTISKKDGTERNFVPYLKQGVAGVFDTVTEKCFYDKIGNSPFFVGKPTGGSELDASEAVMVPDTMSRIVGAGASAGTVGIAVKAAPEAREVWFCWGDEDKGATFSAWPNNERIGTLAANVAAGTYPLPPSARAAKAGRCFLLTAKGSYDCAYIRSERIHAIDTGVYPDPTTAMTIDFKLNEADIVQQRGYGTADNAYTYATYINGSGNWAWGAKNTSGNWYNTGIKATTDRTQITLDGANDKYKLVIDGVVKMEMKISDQVKATDRTKTGEITVALLAYKNKNGTFVNGAMAELYSAQVSTDGKLVRSFTPCVTNGVAVLYDSVGQQYYGNAHTNNTAQFVPGGRKDNPTALVACEPLNLQANFGNDVFGDAAFWLRGMAVDKNGNGVVDDNECKDSLNRLKFDTTVYGTAGKKVVYSNEVVKLPGRGVSRTMQTLYFPQVVTVTNEANGAGYAEPTTLLLKGVTAGFTDHWSAVLRFRPDASTPPNSYQWLAHIGHGGGKGVEFGLRTAGNARSLLMFCGGADATGNWKPIWQPAVVTLTNTSVGCWIDLAVVAEGQKLSVLFVQDGDKMVANSRFSPSQYAYQYIESPRLLTLNSADVRIGAEASTNGKCVYPMGSNDNAIKCFRGSVQQFAMWNRSLSKEEMYMAVGWPRTDLWRVGVDDDASDEFEGATPADGFAVDGEQWPLQNGLASGQSVTMTFPLRDGYETQVGQFLRWKTANGASDSRLVATVNGSPLGAVQAKPGEWALWFVSPHLLKADDNTVTFTRVDKGDVVLMPDVVALGGGWQIGVRDNQYAEFCYESCGLKDYYLASGDMRDIRRVLYCANNADCSYNRFHFNLPAELAGLCRWRFRLDICGDGYSSGGAWPASGKQPLKIQLNDKVLFSRDVTKGESIMISLNPEDMPAGENVFHFTNENPNKKTEYIPLDRMSLCPLTPYGSAILIR